MSRLCKRINEMLGTPPEVDFADVQSIFFAFDWSLREGKGSHVVFCPPDDGDHMTIPRKGGTRVKRFYVKNLVIRLELEDYYKKNCIKIKPKKKELE